MKNVLFATTALVAMAGVASAQEVSFSGSATAGYNDVIEGGLFWNADLTVNGSVDLGDSVTASVKWKFVKFDDAGFTFGTGLIPTVTVAFDNGSLSAKLIAGDQNDKGAAEMWFKKLSGMAADVSNWDNTATDFTAVVEFGNFGVAATTSNTAGGVSFGAKASLGSIDLAAGVDTGAVGPAFGVSAGATFGSMKVEVSYAKGTTKYTAKTGVDANDADATVGGTDTVVTGPETSIGVKVGYDVSSSLKLGAYYASNSVLGAQFGVTAGYTSGALGIDAYFKRSSAYTLTPAGVDVDGDGYYTAAGTAAFATSNSYGVDLSYDISDKLKASAGIQIASSTSYYAGVEYTVNDNITATVSYANANKISGPEFKDGISAFITAKF